MQSANGEIDDATYRRISTQYSNPVISARYSKSADALVLDFENGLLLRVPRRLLQGLQDIAPGTTLLSRITILGLGSGISWDDIDVGFSVERLIEGVFGSEKWMSQLAARAGSVRTARKAASSRENGRKGGRPRKAAMPRDKRA